MRSSTALSERRQRTATSMAATAETRGLTVSMGAVRADLRESKSCFCLYCNRNA